MNCYVVFFATFLINIYFNDAYVVLQLQNKGENDSKIDPVVHKTDPNQKDEQMGTKTARKHNVLPSDFRPRDKKDYGSIYINIDDKDKQKSEIIKDIKEVLDVVLDKISTLTETGFNYRSKDPVVVPKHVNLRNKPSLMYEVNTNSVLDIVNHVLSSEPVQHFVDSVSRKAAVVYRTQF